MFALAVIPTKAHNKRLLTTYQVLGTVAGGGDMKMNRIAFLPLRGFWYIA